MLQERFGFVARSTLSLCRVLGVLAVRPKP